MECEKFWLECPLSLFKHVDILPQKSMCEDSKLNAITRLALVISLVLFFSKIKEWRHFLIGSLVFVLFLKYIIKGCKEKENFKSVRVLNPISYNDQSTPIDYIDSICDGEADHYDHDLREDDIEYIDDTFEPRNEFGVSRLMPDEEVQPEGMDRKQLQFMNNVKFAERTIEARESVVQFFKKELAERFEPDEYYESY